MTHLRQDLTYAVRRLWRAPGFTAAAVVTLALGIGVNTAIFSVVHGVLMKPLPYQDSGRLVGVFHVYQGDQRGNMDGPDFIDLMKSVTSLESVAALTASRMNLTGAGEPTRLTVATVSAALFSVLRVRPETGRLFTAEENTPDRTNIVILSDGLWRERFGGDPAVLGRRIMLDGVPREVVGVMPASFAYPDKAVAWMPIKYDASFVSTERGFWNLTVVGRLKPGITPTQSAAEAETIGRRLAKEYPAMNEGIGITDAPLLDTMVSGIRRSVLVLLGAVGFVLLIACTNVANLLLARASARSAELAVRTALGAGRGRLMSELVTESVVLSGLGVGAGLLLAKVSVALLIGLKPAGIPRLGSVSIDGTVILVAIVVGVATGGLFGLVPAFAATRGLTATLKEAGRSAVTRRTSARLRAALVVAELCLAVMLLAGAGLLLHSFANLQAVDPGFKPARTLTFDLTLPDSRYVEDEPRLAFFDQLLPKLRALPGVTSATTVMALPLSGASYGISFSIKGRPPVPPALEPVIEVRVATPDYFEALGIPIVRGRGFTDRDIESSPHVLLINEATVRRFFPGEEPLGKTMNIEWGRGKGRHAGGEIVGVIADTKESALNDPAEPMAFMTYPQWPVPSMTVVMKTSTPPLGMTQVAKQTLYGIDANLPMSNVRTLDSVVATSISQPRFYMLLLSIFAAVALVLAAVGIFGVLSYTVSQRTREIGIRMALGARESRVVGLVVYQAATLIATGIGTGVLAALLLSKTMAKMLFDVKPTDPAAFATAAAVLAAVALVASYLPARRAARVDPIIALRAE